MKRVIGIAAAIAIALSSLSAAGCSPKVEVRTGTKVICTYGEVVSDSTRTIKVPADEAGKYQVRTITKICDRHAQLEALYAAAQTALAAGDLETAKEKLQQVVAIDPTYAKAASQLDTIAEGKKPAPDTDAPTGSAPPGDTATDEPGDTPADKPGDTSTGAPAESLLSWAPDAITGFSARKAIVDPLSISREYIPAQGSDVVTFVVVAEQFSSNSLATAALTTQVKNRYTKDVDTIEIGGHSVYFGTDGRRFAAMGFVDGSVMVLLEMSGKSGADPKVLKSALSDAVRQLP